MEYNHIPMQHIQSESDEYLMRKFELIRNLNTEGMPHCAGLLAIGPPQGCETI